MADRAEFAVVAPSPGSAIWVWQIDSTAAVGIAMAVATTAIALVLRGRSRPDDRPGQWSAVALGLIAASQMLLSLAGNPLSAALAWQVHWLAVCGISFSGASDEQRTVTFRMLVTGWLFDAVFLLAAVQDATLASWTDHGMAFPMTGRVLTGGMALAAAHRIGLLPVGTVAHWGDCPRREFRLWAFVVVLPPVAVIALRLRELVFANPTLAGSTPNLLLLGCGLAILTGWGQTTAVRRSAWAAAVLLGASFAVTLSLPQGIAIAWWLGLTAAGGLVLLRSSQRTELVVRVASPLPESFGPLVRRAGEEWSLPKLWRVAIEMPLRGASHVVRFADGILFEQLPRRISGRVLAGPAAVLERLPPTVRQLIWPALCGAMWLLLLVQALR